MNSRIERHPDAFKGPLQRRPRVKDGNHLDFIRTLPCLVCGAFPVEAAHIRMSSEVADKRETGIAEKPDDAFTVPLCAKCHRTGPESQHNIGEYKFWQKCKIPPIFVSLALWQATGDYERGFRIIEVNR